jgi:putative ABC transport system ATP-binding protein
VFSYGKTPALRGLSLDVGEGESVAVTGPSGSGKSTMLHCVAGLLRPDSGEMWVAGEPVHTLGEQRRARLRRRTFGLVYQFDQLLPELTVEENVALPLYFDGVRRDRAAERAARWLRRLELGDRADRQPHALAGEPRVLLADEPTGALDTDEADHVLRILRSAVLSHGMTLLIVTHDPRVVAYTDRSVRIADGRVAHDGLVPSP